MAADLFDRILDGVSGRSPDAGIRLTSICQPSGGPGTRLMPPTYPGGYVHEERVLDDGVFEVVQLDSFQSQANRAEESLLQARDDGDVKLPLFEMIVSVGAWTVRLTSLDFPHRYADAYLRDSKIDGVRFDETDIGKALRVAEPRDASAIYRYDPGSLLFGAWNSHRSGRQPKFSRSYRSEALGIGFKTAHRKGGRLDPLNLTGAVDDAAKQEGDWKFTVAEKAKGKRLSKIGHGNALSGEEAPGGVTATEVRRLGFVSFAQLSKLRFGNATKDASAAARAALASLALIADRLAFDRAGLAFRSGCELTVVTDTVAWERRGGDLEEFTVSVDDAIALFQDAVARATDAGLPMSTDTIAVEPIDSLRKAIDHAVLAADSQG